MNVEEHLKRQNELLDRLTQINSEDFKTKREIIQELIDATRPLIESGYYQWNKRNFASYIYQQLEEYKIEYPRGEYFYNLFDDSEKREERGTNFESQNEIHSHKFNEDDECECGVIKHNDILYDVAPEIVIDKTDLEKNITKDEPKPDPFSNPYTEYLQRIKFNCDELSSICSDWIKKYYSNVETAKAIEKSFKPNIDEQKTLEAKLIHMGKQSDFRQKIGEFEKVKAILLERTTYNLAKVAKMLAITPKHLSHNILKDIDKYMNNLKWFRSIIFECRKCGAENTIEHADWYNEQIERKTLGLHMIKP